MILSGVCKLGFTIAPSAAVHHVLGQCPAETHGDRTIDLPATLHRIDQAPDIRRVHAVQDADLGRDTVTATRTPCTLKAIDRGER